jgi:hypothetical protein
MLVWQLLNEIGFPNAAHRWWNGELWFRVGVIAGAIHCILSY